MLCSMHPESSCSVLQRSYSKSPTCAPVLYACGSLRQCMLSAHNIQGASDMFNAFLGTSGTHGTPILT